MLHFDAVFSCLNVVFKLELMNSSESCVRKNGLIVFCSINTNDEHISLLLGQKY